MNCKSLKTATLIAALLLSFGSASAAGLSNIQKSAIADLNVRLQALNIDKIQAAKAASLKTQAEALEYSASNANVSAKQLERDWAKLQQAMLATEQELLKARYVAPIDTAIRKLQSGDADAYAHYAYKNTKALRKATLQLIENSPAKVNEIARYSAAALKQAEKSGSLTVDAKKITRIGERDAERFIAHMSWLLDQINKNSPNPVDLTGKDLDQKVAAIIGKPLPLTPLQKRQAAKAKAKANSEAKAKAQGGE